MIKKFGFICVIILILNFQVIKTRKLEIKICIKILFKVLELNNNNIENIRNYVTG